MTIPRLQAYIKYWKKNPPQHVSTNAIRYMIANFLGYEESGDAVDHESGNIDSAADFMPVNKLSEADFNQVLEQFKIPVQSH
jgi:hypothetical protein